MGALDDLNKAIEELRNVSNERWQEALRRARILQHYIYAQRAIDTLREELATMSAKTPRGDYTILDIYAQALDAMEMSITQHKITWEHQHAQ